MAAAGVLALLVSSIAVAHIHGRRVAPKKHNVVGSTVAAVDYEHAPASSSFQQIRAECVSHWAACSKCSECSEAQGQVLQMIKAQNVGSTGPVYDYQEQLGLFKKMGGFKPCTTGSARKKTGAQSHEVKLNADCSKFLWGEYFDIDRSIKKNAKRFQLILGSDDEPDVLPSAPGLRHIIHIAQMINRPIFYQQILETNTGHWATTSITGALTIMKLLEAPIQKLGNSPMTVCDAGHGSGYLLAALALMTPKNSVVVGIEYEMDMAQLSADYLHSRATFDTNKLEVGGKKGARMLASKIKIYQGDAMSMTITSVPKMSGCEETPPWSCGKEIKVRNDTFDILNVGFGLFPPFPDSILRTVREGGYILVPTCFKISDHGYCKEKMTLYQKSLGGKVNLVSDVDGTPIPTVEGKFFYLGADPSEIDDKYFFNS